MSRAIKSLAALALTGASVLGVTSQASADPNPNNYGDRPTTIQLRTSDHVGVYTAADPGSGKVNGNLTLSPGDYIVATCWVVGANVGSAGDVWYRTAQVHINGGGDIYTGAAYTFAPYVDYAAAFHNVPGVPHCL
ncbi:hypothetical protein DN069_35135 [Streptacidiphilus pinicola]|uniref:SH3 domain-containing protein n=1 Tax=Streptacidiphilus pinicola TaxID=2219663 RepID=A0A2X0I7Q3_9ACTN|nr:hypothetical protein [Streptacidiphilus pinicola]RAG80954.1 hypothetical protein DN069_35135 [Streptacidiphilus pinicola]